MFWSLVQLWVSMRLSNQLLDGLGYKLQTYFAFSISIHWLNFQAILTSGTYKDSYLKVFD